MKTEIVRQHSLSRLISLRDYEDIKVITGVRRCGKSTLLRSYAKWLAEQGVDRHHIIFLNLEDEDNALLLKEANLHRFVIEHLVDEEMHYAILDEVQMVPDFDRAINSLHLRSNIDLYVTGSNAYLLSSELATLLTGRHMDISLLPLSFAEYCQCFNAPKDILFEQYLNYGGLPGTLDYQANGDFRGVTDYLKNLNNQIIAKDIKKRKNLKNETAILRVADFLHSAIGSPISSSKIARTFKSQNESDVTEPTILNYISYLNESYLFYKAKDYDLKGKSLLKKNYKEYSVDVGLSNAVLGNDKGANIGHKLENIVYLELIRRGWDVCVGKFYDGEIDFVCKRRNNQCYIQVAYLLATEDVIAREFGVFSKLRDGYKRIVLSLDRFDMSQNGIMHQNIVDWLIDEDQA
jgi:predicted AAA+ superfamily ATPase